MLPAKTGLLAQVGDIADILELANGCLCCSMKSELVAGLEGLLAQRHRFDYILIETSGAGLWSRHASNSSWTFKCFMCLGAVHDPLMTSSDTCRVQD